MLKKLEAAGQRDVEYGSKLAQQHSARVGLMQVPLNRSSLQNVLASTFDQCIVPPRPPLTSGAGEVSHSPQPLRPLRGGCLRPEGSQARVPCWRGCMAPQVSAEGTCPGKADAYQVTGPPARLPARAPHQYLQLDAAALLAGGGQQEAGLHRALALGVVHIGDARGAAGQWTGYIDVS